MLVLTNGTRVLIDHITWFSLRQDTVKNKWLLQFGYAGGDKTFVAYEREADAVREFEIADQAIRQWVNV